MTNLIKGRTQSLQWLGELMSFFQTETIKIPKNYRTRVVETKKLLNKFTDIKIIKVKGHAGVIENEIADKLATSAIK